MVGNLGRGTGDADTVSLLDLTREPWRVVDTVSVGQTPEGVAASPDNRHVAVTVMNGSNKPAGSPFHGPGLVKLLRIENGRLSVASEARVGTWPQGVAFSADGRTLLVGNMVEREVQVLRVAEDGKLTDSGTRIRRLRRLRRPPRAERGDRRSRWGRRGDGGRRGARSRAGRRLTGRPPWLPSLPAAKRFGKGVRSMAHRGLRFGIFLAPVPPGGRQPDAGAGPRPGADRHGSTRSATTRPGSASTTRPAGS